LAIVFIFLIMLIIIIIGILVIAGINYYIELMYPELFFKTNLITLITHSIISVFFLLKKSKKQNYTALYWVSFLIAISSAIPGLIYHFIQRSIHHQQFFYFNNLIPLSIISIIIIFTLKYFTLVKLSNLPEK
jgi:hypothetical protein